jgi:BRCA1-associated protein
VFRAPSPDPTNAYEGLAVAAFEPHSQMESGTTNLPEGIVHLYRDMQHVGTIGGSVLSGQGTSSSDKEDDGLTLAVLAAPFWMTPSDFLSFVAPAEDGLKHLRIVRYVILDTCLER